MSDPKEQQLSPDNFPTALRNAEVAIVQAQWNTDITSVIEKEARNTLESFLTKGKVETHQVPGAFELPLAASWLAESQPKLRGIICVGCLIKGETPHFEYISETVSQSIGSLNLKYKIPVIFGVLTVLNKEQAIARIDGTHGNKGQEY